MYIYISLLDYKNCDPNDDAYVICDRVSPFIIFYLFYSLRRKAFEKPIQVVTRFSY